jgi:diguanylate cyclase (GGDEF)-like protein/PAS domain S-box-containing protein
MTHSPELHTDTLDALPTPAVVAVSGQIVHANPACLVLLEAEQADQVLGRSYSDFTHPLDLARARRRVQALSQGDTPGQRNQSTSYRMQTCCGNTRMVLLASAKVLWQGQPALLVSGIDMTHLDRLQHEMQESERNFRRLFEKMQDVYYRTDAQGVVQHVGPGVRRVLGYEPREIEGRTAESYYPQSKDRDAFKVAILEHGEVSDFPGQMVRRDGQVIDISISSHALYDQHGQFAGVEGIYRDVTQRKNLERELHRLASTDMLTGLSNRRVLLEAAESLFLASASASDSGAVATPAPALLILDLDHFKTINDRYGHLEGDRALIEFAAVVRAELRGSDVVGRMGGEEFAVLLPDTRGTEAEAIAQRILQQLRQRQLWSGDDQHPRGMTASIGVASRLPSDRHLRDWLDRADKALYQAKHLGRDRVVLAD